MLYKSSNEAFGGMKKGFLFSSSSKTSSASRTSNSSHITSDDFGQKTEDENIPFITAKKDSSDSRHRFYEVQQAMKINNAFAMNKGDFPFMALLYFAMFYLQCLTHSLEAETASSL